MAWQKCLKSNDFIISPRQKFDAYANFSIPEFTKSPANVVLTKA